MSDVSTRPAGMAGDVRRPAPVPDQVSEGFWSAAERGKLAIQRCTNCGTYHHPPRPLCRACGGSELTFEPVSGEGRLWSWTVTHHNVASGFEAAIPYTCMIIELAEQDGLFVLSDLVGREDLRDGLQAGMPMRVIFPESPGGGPVLPQFEPATTAEGS